MRSSGFEFVRSRGFGRVVRAPAAVAAITAITMSLGVTACVPRSSTPPASVPADASVPPPTEPEEPEDLSAVPTDAFDPFVFARTYVGSRLALFAPSSMPPATITRTLRGTRSAPSRRALRRALVVSHLLAAEQATPGPERELARRAMQRESRLALSGNRDAHLAAELAFAELWVAWISHVPDVVHKAETFAERHAVDRELLRVVTLIRAELAIERGAHAEARATLALLLGNSRDPLHAYASYRTAASFCAEGHPAECRQWREQTRLLGCAPEPAPEIRELAERAYGELGSPVVARRDRERGAPRYCSHAATASFRDVLFAR